MNGQRPPTHADKGATTTPRAKAGRNIKKLKFKNELIKRLLKRGKEAAKWHREQIREIRKKGIKWHKEQIKRLKSKDYRKEFELFENLFRKFNAFISKDGTLYVRCEKYKCGEVIQSGLKLCERCLVEKVASSVGGIHRHCLFTMQSFNKHKEAGT